MIIASVIGIAIIIATVYFALKFRYRAGKNDNPKQVHGNTRLEIGWTIVPALLLAVVAVPTISTIFDLAAHRRPTRSKSPSSASSGGGSSSTPTPRWSPPTSW